jgi:hypothetical protein
MYKPFLFNEDTLVHRFWFWQNEPSVGNVERPNSDIQMKGKKDKLYFVKMF